MFVGCEFLSLASCVQGFGLEIYDLLLPDAPVFRYLGLLQLQVQRTLSGIP